MWTTGVRSVNATVALRADKELKQECTHNQQYVDCAQPANAEPNSMLMRRQTKVETKSIWTNIVDRHPGSTLDAEYPSTV